MIKVMIKDSIRGMMAVATSAATSVEVISNSIEDGISKFLIGVMINLARAIV